MLMQADVYLDMFLETVHSGKVGSKAFEYCLKAVKDVLTKWPKNNVIKGVVTIFERVLRYGDYKQCTELVLLVDDWFTKDNRTQVEVDYGDLEYDSRGTYHCVPECYDRYAK